MYNLRRVACYHLNATAGGQLRKSLWIGPLLPIPSTLVQVASTSLLYAAPRPRNVVYSVPSRLGEHPGEATLLHGKAVKARSATSKIHTSGLWIDKLANQELLSQEESRNATPTREPAGSGLDLPI